MILSLCHNNSGTVPLFSSKRHKKIIEQFQWVAQFCASVHLFYINIEFYNFKRIYNAVSLGKPVKNVEKVLGQKMAAQATPPHRLFSCGALFE